MTFRDMALCAVMDDVHHRTGKILCVWEIESDYAGRLETVETLVKQWKNNFRALVRMGWNKRDAIEETRKTFETAADVLDFSMGFGWQDKLIKQWGRGC